MNPYLRRFLVLFGTMILGFAIGFGWFSITEADGLAPLPVVEVFSSPKQVDADRRAKSMAAIQEVTAPAADANTDSMQRFLDEADAAGMRVIPIDSLRALDVKTIVSGKVADDMQEILSLSEEEVERLNRVIDRGGERLRDAELERIQVVEVSDNRAVFFVPALGEIGHHVKREFEEELKRTLGHLDAHTFLTVMEDGHISHWDGFGRFDRTITFSVEPRDDERVWLQFEQESPADQVREYFRSQGRGIGGNVGMGRGFGTLYPRGQHHPLPSRSLQRSAYLIPLLPEGLRFYFEEVEKGN